MLMLGLGKKGGVVEREKEKLKRGVQVQAVDCLGKRKKDIIFP